MSNCRCHPARRCFQCCDAHSVRDCQTCLRATTPSKGQSGRNPTGDDRSAGSSLPTFPVVRCHFDGAYDDVTVIADAIAHAHYRAVQMRRQLKREWAETTMAERYELGGEG